jgi:SAP domain-containing ribonucleoprotein
LRSARLYTDLYSQKLKVTELKELLSKHDLPQTGKKDDLVKRLVEAGIAPEVEVAGGEQEELVSSPVPKTLGELADN